ncbi:iduronate 2-sulfatase-like [Diadema antillarum]|uniref:iduronate 2-sulfatase-like n=1 Tax=Diadema antillarum TaxID=105358 RepID=UPI003A8B80EB
MSSSCSRTMAVPLLIYTVVACFLSQFQLDSASRIDKPNVLFIVIDDLRPSLDCYGGPIISPNIDQLAAQSAVFTNAMVQQSLCAPSRTSFLTGRRPDTTRVYNFDSYWRVSGGNYTTLPQHFKESGYFTASVGKVFHPGVPSGGDDDYRYSWSIPAYHPSTEQYIKAKVCPNLDGTLHNNIMCPVDVEEMPEHTLPDLQAFERAAEILRNLSVSARGRPGSDDSADAGFRESMKPPFFLGVGYRKPHVPWKYPKAYQALYPLESVEIASNPNIPEKMPSVAWDDFHSLRLRDDLKAMNLSFPFGTIPLDFHGPMRQNYYAAATYTDYQVGRLLQVLEASGFADDTIILFVGDHGWQLGEHGEWCKFSNFELATRVPLMVHVPGVTDTNWLSAQKFTLKDPLKAPNRVLVDHKADGTLSWKKFRDDKITWKKSTGLPVGLPFRSPKSEGNDVLEPKGNQHGVSVDAFVELVDIFPSVSELAGLTIPPICPPNSFDVDFCAEGVSFAPLIMEDYIADRWTTNDSRSLQKIKRWKNATFSQYPRPSVHPGKLTDVPHLANITIMGYSMRTIEYHYTEWIGFSNTTFEGDWNDVKARELYVNELDPEQNNNVADVEKYKDIVKMLSGRLQRGWRDCLPVISGV